MLLDEENAKYTNMVLNAVETWGITAGIDFIIFQTLFTLTQLMAIGSFHNNGEPTWTSKNCVKHVIGKYITRYFIVFYLKDLQA